MQVSGKGVFRGRRWLLTGLALGTVALAARAISPKPGLPPEVFLIADTTIGDRTAVILAEMLAAKSGVRVKHLLSIGLAGGGLPVDGQVEGAALLALVQPTADRVRRLYDAPDAAFILLTSRDINAAEFGTRYLFAFRDTRINLSVVSSARTQVGEPGKPVALERVIQRIMKLLLRAVGELALHLPRSSDPKSVMYSPLMGIDDLDMIGESLGTGI